LFSDPLVAEVYSRRINFVRPCQRSKGEISSLSKLVIIGDSPDLSNGTEKRNWAAWKIEFVFKHIHVPPDPAGWSGKSLLLHRSPQEAPVKTDSLPIVERLMILHARPIRIEPEISEE
jgi:hypothetical protein